MNMKYEPLGPIDRGEATLHLGSGVREQVCTTLVRLALFDPERRWVEPILERFLTDTDPWIRGVAAICAGHVARIHHAIAAERVLPLLRALLDHPETAGKAQDALDDIEMFVHRDPESPPS